MIGAQLGAEPRIAQCARHQRQSLEVIDTRIGRGKQHENQIDRVLIGGVEIDRLLKLEKRAMHLGQLGKPRVR